MALVGYLSVLPSGFHRDPHGMVHGRGRPATLGGLRRAAHGASYHALPDAAGCCTDVGGVWRNLCAHLCRRYPLYLSLATARTAPHSRARAGNEPEAAPGGGWSRFARHDCTRQYALMNL